MRNSTKRVLNLVYYYIINFTLTLVQEILMLLNIRKDMDIHSVKHRYGNLAPMLVSSLILLFGLSLNVLAITPNAGMNGFSANAHTIAEVVGATGSAVSVEFHSILAANHTWTARRYSISQNISHAYGSPIKITMDLSDNSLSEAAIRFVSRNEEALGFVGVDPIIRSIAAPPNYKVVSVYAEFEGIPIYDSYAILSINLRGELALLKAQGFDGNAIGSFSISERQAIEYAREALNAPDGSVVAQQIYYPSTDNDQIVLLPAFEIQIDTPQPAFQPTAFINATDGSLLASENRVRFIDVTGNISGSHHPMYGLDEPEQEVFQRDGIRVDGELVTVSDENGDFQFEIVDDDLPAELSSMLLGWWANVAVWQNNGWVRGASFDVEIENGEEAIDIVWDDDNSRIDERDLYVHVNIIHDFFKDLVPEWEGMDYPMLAVCNLEMDNAFSNGQGIFFGRRDQLGEFGNLC